MWALAELQFRRLWIGQAASCLGDRIAPIALAFAVLHWHGSASDLGVVIAAQTVPLAGFLLVGGVWADRLDRRRVMLTCDLVRALTQFVMAALILSGEPALWQLAGCAAVLGTAEAFFRPAATGLVPQVVSAQLLAKANALLGLSLNASMIAGPLIAGALIAASNPGSAIAIDAATFLISAGFLFRVRPSPGSRSAAQRSFRSELAAGLREVTSRRWLAATVTAFTVYQCVVLPGVTVLGPVVAGRRYGGATGWAWTTAAFGAGAVIGSIVALRAHPSKPLVVVSVLLIGGSLQPLVIGVGLPLPIVAVLLAGAGACVAILFAVWDTTLAKQIAPHTLSRVSAFDHFGSVIGMPIGFAVIGPIAEHFGTTPTMIAVSIVGALFAVYTAALPDVRQLTELDVSHSGLPTPEGKP